MPLVSGYAIRTCGITSAQSALGNAPVVLTGPNHQFRDPTAKDEVIDHVSYIRTASPTGLARHAMLQRWAGGRELAIVQLLRRSIADVLKTREFDVLHAHSPALNGLAALRVARARGLPFVYEIRAFWEDAAVDLAKTTNRSLRYRAIRRLEEYVVNRADAVVVIARGIRDELRSRVISENKLFHVPNGVDTTKFRPIPRNEILASKLGIADTPVLGFIGSFFPFEGVPWLVRAAAELRRRGLTFKLLIVGHGKDAELVRREIVENNAQEYVLFVGKVPHDVVRDYYSLIDVMVYPRASIRLTELVTPLKPLEAMAQGRAVLASDVGGIRELVENESTGLLFAPEDVNDFCRQASRLITCSDLRSRLAEGAKNMVIRCKQWTTIARQYDQIYAFAQATARANH